MILDILGRLANTEVMIAVDKGPWASECLKGMASFERMNELIESASTDTDFWYADDDWRSYYRPYKVSGGILTIPVRGMMLHDFSFQLGSWATGYTYIRKAFERGLADPEVRAISMVINSGGGEVAGNFDLVDFIFASRGSKPFYAVVNEHAYSAAYAIASAADQIYLPRTGGVGSIGVYTMHVSREKMLKDAGIEVEFVFSGDHKVDGNSYQSLPEPVKKRMQARVTSLYNVFTSTVARNTGIAEEVIIATQALTYGAEEAVEIGLAHKVLSYDDALAAVADGGATETETEEFLMGTKPEDVQAATAADVDAARAEGVTTGAQAERARIKGILGCEEAAERPKLATHLAMNTSQSVEDSQALLAASAVEAKEVVKVEADVAAPKGDAFSKAMDETPNPEVGAEQGKGGGSEVSATATILADFRAATGEPAAKTTH